MLNRRIDPSFFLLLITLMAERTDLNHWRITYSAQRDPFNLLRSEGMFRSLGAKD